MQKQPVNVDLDLNIEDFEEVLCPKCGKKAFERYTAVFKLSAVHPKNKAGQTLYRFMELYRCARCRHPLPPQP